MTLTPEQLAAIRERANAATPTFPEFGFVVPKADLNNPQWSRVSADHMRFISHAYADVPILLDEVDRLTARIKELEASHVVS